MAADDTQTQPPPDTSQGGLLDPAIQQLVQQLMPQPIQVDQTPVHQSWLSQLGEKLAGGTGGLPMSPQQKQDAGLRSLRDFGVGLMAASHYQPGQTIFSNLAQGFQGAQRGELSSGEMAAQVLGAQQAYQQQQAQTKLAALKEAIPLLQLQRMMRQGNPLVASGGSATTTPGTSTASPTIADVLRDPKYETAGQQANNPGNLMATDAPGQSGAITLSGGRKLAAFPDAPTGVAANADNLAAYQTKYGINTVQDAVKRWVSDPKADLTSYINDVAGALGVKPTDKIDLTNPAVQRAFILAQQPHETGGKTAWLSPNDVDAGIALSQQRRQGPPGGGGGGRVAATPPVVPPPPGTVPAPAAAPPAGGGGQPSIGAFLQPPAPGSAANVVPGLAGVQKGTQQYGVAPPPVVHQAVIPGRRADAGQVGQDVGAILGGQVGQDVGAILGGMQGGAPGGGPAPVLAAGPAAPTGGAPSLEAALRPASGGPPPATTTGPAQPAPQLTTQQPDTRPDVELTPAEYLQRHFKPASDVERQTFTVPVDQGAMARAQTAMAEATKAKAAAGQAYGNAMSPADQTKAADAYTKANADWQTANSAVSTLQQQAQIETAKAVAKFEEDQRSRLSTTYNQLQAQRAAAQLKAQEGEQAINLENVKTGNATSQKLQEAYTTDAANSGKRIDDLELLRGLSDNAGSPTLLTSIKIGDRSLADLISATGFGGKDLQDKVGAIQAFRAGVLNTVRELRTGGAATGEPRSNQDLQFVQDMAPNEWQSPQTRSAIISFLQQVNQRRIDMAAEVARLSATRGTNGQLMPAGEAVAQARKNLPDFVQKMPDNAIGNTPEALQARKDFFNSSVPPHTFFRYPNGRIDLYNGPGG